ncbi:MAG: hypothetical protein PHW80_07655 [Smithellaceae bacterium]|jgi:hypothetical protein|nr:hypothetical protein [Smithellaceae bacterium]MDD3259345.1 hypothetical protein [Smithellaceae bacterium]MDD3849159.1 hypothetical protein [Smithellaceae bacterium]HOC61236.1 hypothetical protein [Smithellaceae bacterium]HOG12002.1 hypothetical protein [Smithellaceae bacterium]
MTPTTTGLIGFAVLIILMFWRMPVGFAMALTEMKKYKYDPALATGVVAGAARDVPLHIVFKGSLNMLYAMIALAVLLMVFPKIATFLPQLL